MSTSERVDIEAGAAVAAPVPSLRERARQAVDEARRQAAAHEAEAARKRREERMELLRRLLPERLDVEPEHFTAEGHAVVEDLRFSAWQRPWHSEYGHHEPELYLVGACPRCGQTAISAEVCSLAGLAELLDEFRPHRGHECELPETEQTAPDPPPTPTLGERLEELMREIAREEIRRDVMEGF